MARNRSSIIIMVIVFLLLVAVGVGVYFYLQGQDDQVTEDGEEKAFKSCSRDDECEPGFCTDEGLCSTGSNVIKVPLPSL